MRGELEKALNDYLTYKGISISVVSERTGISSGVLYNTFRADRRIRGDELLLICEFLGVDPKIFTKIEQADLRLAHT